MSRSSNNNNFGSSPTRRDELAPPSPGAIRSDGKLNRIDPKNPPKPYGAYVEFKNGMPIPRYNPPPDGLMVISKAEMDNIRSRVWSEPFDGAIYNPFTGQTERPEHLQKFIGRPIAEVQARIQQYKSLAGDQRAYEYEQDRMHGKPVQERHNLNATITKEDLIGEVDKLADEVLGPIIDVTPNSQTIDELNIDKILEDF